LRYIYPLNGTLAIIDYIRCMDKRMILNGAGTYYFEVHGAKDAPLFRSVFEYEYFKKILSQEQGCELIAYVFFEHKAHWVMHCSQDWQIVLDNIRAQMQELHFKLWHKHQQVISESANVVLVEEDTYLVPLVMELHHQPVREGLVARPDVYPWSSDQYYRHDQQPTWLASHRMLKRMAKHRFNSALRYERMMEQFEPWDINQAKNRLYQAIACDSYISSYLAAKPNNLAPSKEQVITLRRQAEELICTILGAPIEQVRHPRFRRQYFQVEPLTVWLLLQSHCTIHQLVFTFDLDETVMNGWLRSIPNQHPESFLKKLQQRWQEDLHIQNLPILAQSASA
jgi:hypothetical protein